MKRAKLWRGVAGLVVAAVALTACSGHDETSQGNEPAAPMGVISALRARYEAASMVRPFESVEELLANTKYRVEGGPSRPLTEAVIVGTVVEVRPGSGFRIEGEDAPDGIESDFNDSRVLWRTVHVRVAVQSVLSGTLEGDQVDVGFAFGANLPFARIEKDFESLGSLLLLLNRSPVFAYQPNIYSTVSDGSLLGLVDDDGRIELPILEENESRQLLANVSTLKELRLAAKAPEQVVEVNAAGMRTRD